MTVTVNVGHYNYGYSKQEPTISTLAAPEIVAEIKKKIDWKKYGKIVAVATIGITSALILFDTTVAEAASTVAYGPVEIDTSPVDSLMKTGYHALLKLTLYTLTPIYGWAGYILIFAGAAVAKRTLAKQVAGYATLGAIVVAAAPYAAWQLYKVATHAF